MKAYPIPAVRSEGNPHFEFCMDGAPRRVLKRWAIQFIRQNGILLATLALFVVWSLGISAVEHHADWLYIPRHEHSA